MKTLALAMAAAATLAFTAPSFAASAAPDRIQLAQADVSVRIGGDHHRGDRHRHSDRREVRMHRDHGRHEGWRDHDRHHGNKVVIIKKHRGNGTTVIKKRVSHRD
jgi:hypothetical protein